MDDTLAFGNILYWITQLSHSYNSTLVLMKVSQHVYSQLSIFSLSPLTNTNLFQSVKIQYNLVSILICIKLTFWFTIWCFGPCAISRTCTNYTCITVVALSADSISSFTCHSLRSQIIAGGMEWYKMLTSSSCHTNWNDNIDNLEFKSTLTLQIPSKPD